MKIFNTIFARNKKKCKIQGENSNFFDGHQNIISESATSKKSILSALLRRARFSFANIITVLSHRFFHKVLNGNVQ